MNYFEMHERAPLENPQYPRLFVIGDSFSIGPRPGDPARVWTRIVAEQLGDHLGEPVLLCNQSLMGSSQDFAWGVLQDHWFGMNSIRPQDYLIIALTHPNRFWYFENMPEMSNTNIIDLDSWVTKEQSRAVELYAKCIQRPQLDTLMLMNRMGYLAYQTIRSGMKNKPLLIKCFTQNLGDSYNWPEINVAKGTLMDDIQIHEFWPEDLDEDQTYWRGLDSRYNHMVLSNHMILGAAVADSLIYGTQLDLTAIEFHKKILLEDSLKDREFCLRELDVKTLDINFKYRDDYKPILPWKKRKQLKDNHMIPKQP
jgi:hypothetical protein